MRLTAPNLRVFFAAVMLRVLQADKRKKDFLSPRIWRKNVGVEN